MRTQMHTVRNRSLAALANLCDNKVDTVRENSTNIAAKHGLFSVITCIFQELIEIRQRNERIDSEVCIVVTTCKKIQKKTPLLLCF